ncbi:MAG: NUDIX hydrolase [Deltaproteobacteria bacterium]|nr:NUDIX hydrolase [Deltaproteobacteria bacterium]
MAVGAIVIKDNRVLLVKRSKPPGEGLWAIPGGRVELGETLQQAAEREIMEETGLTIKAKDPVYTFEVIEPDDAGRPRFHYVIVDLMADYVKGGVSPGSAPAMTHPKPAGSRPKSWKTCPLVKPQERF